MAELERSEMVEGRSRELAREEGLCWSLDLRHLWTSPRKERKGIEQPSEFFWYTLDLFLLINIIADYFVVSHKSLNLILTKILSGKYFIV
jgi:hypothetical protein